MSLVGQYLKRFAQIDQIIDPRFPISGQGGIATSSLPKAYVGLLCTGKSDFDAIESRRQDAFFRDALGLVAVPSSPTLRQRMDALADSGDTALGNQNGTQYCSFKKNSVRPEPVEGLLVSSWWFDKALLSLSKGSPRTVNRTALGKDHDLFTLICSYIQAGSISAPLGQVTTPKSSRS